MHIKRDQVEAEDCVRGRLRAQDGFFFDQDQEKRKNLLLLAFFSLLIFYLFTINSYYYCEAQRGWGCQAGHDCSSLDSGLAESASALCKTKDFITRSV
jgi:hypothetical protein